MDGSVGADMTDEVTDEARGDSTRPAATRQRRMLSLLLLIATLPPLDWFGEPVVRDIAWSATGSPRQEEALYRSVVPLGSLARSWLAERVRVRSMHPAGVSFNNPEEAAQYDADSELYGAVKSLPSSDLRDICEDLLRSGEPAAVRGPEGGRARGSSPVEPEVGQVEEALDRSDARDRTLPRAGQGGLARRAGRVPAAARVGADAAARRRGQATPQGGRIAG